MNKYKRKIKPITLKNFSVAFIILLIELTFCSAKGLYKAARTTPPTPASSKTI